VAIKSLKAFNAQMP